LVRDVVTGGVMKMVVITDAETGVATDREPQVVMVAGGSTVIIP
jgi:hypothetical protein